MSDLCEVVITAPDADWLAAFTRRLVDDRLCAGAHEIERIRAIYRWDGRVHDKPEARVALHTRAELVAAITERASEEHPLRGALRRCAAHHGRQSRVPGVDRQ